MGVRFLSASTRFQFTSFSPATLSDTLFTVDINDFTFSTDFFDNGSDIPGA
jgi:hypothetical protein